MKHLGLKLTPQTMTETSNLFVLTGPCWVYSVVMIRRPGSVREDCHAGVIILMYKPEN